jgi:hypothetical protein
MLALVSYSTVQLGCLIHQGFVGEHEDKRKKMNSLLAMLVLQG